MTVTAPTVPQVRPLDAAAVAFTVVMCTCWGLNQVAIKFALPDVPPMLQVVARTFGGLLMVLIWVRVRGIKIWQRDGTLLPGIVSGVFFAVEFTLIYGGMLLTSASRAVLFLYTAPFFVAVGALWIIPGEHLRMSQWFGLGLCFTGVAAAMGVPHPGVATLAGDLMLLGGGAMWGATTLVIKGTRLATVAPEKALIYQLATSVPIMAVVSVMLGESVVATPRASALMWLAFQVLVVGFTFPLWFTYLQRYSATRLSAFTFLTPLFGVAAGCIMLNEPFTLTFAAAVLLVIGGLVLVNRRA